MVRPSRAGSGLWNTSVRNLEMASDSARRCLARPRWPDGLPGADARGGHEHRRHQGGGGEGGLVAPPGLLQPVSSARRPGDDGFVVQVPLEVRRQAVGRLVAAGAVLLQALHHDPVQVAPDQFHQMHAFGAVLFGGGGEGFPLQRAQARARPRRLLFADRPAHGVQTLLGQFLRVERRAGRSAVRRAARPGCRCRCACQCPARSSPPAPGSCRPACR